ncbi:MAG: class I adenylate-forming enzyme family protein [Actinomycetota bacterium]|nr:class I adenylate-forming enzyme family protein [Actinomycetota bacterium]
MNLMMLLEMAAGGFGERVAIGPRDGGLTYQRLYDLAGTASRRFRDAGVEHVAMADVSSEALPIALFGAAWADLPFVPLNYRLTDEELAALAGRIAPAITVLDPDAPGRLDGVDGTGPIDRHDLLAVLADGDAMGKAPEPDWDMDGEDAAILLFTSGTTGEPKAAVLRHRHLVSYVLGSVEFMGAGEEEAALVSVPPYHVAGMAAILSNLYAGRRVVQLPTFDAAAWVDMVRCEAVTSAMVVPTMLTRIVEYLDAEGPDGSGLPTLRSLSYGGGKMPRPTIEQALEMLPRTAFVNAYGLTETSSTVALLGPEDHRKALASDDPDVRARLGSAGRPLPTIEVSIRNGDGNEVAVGEPGEVWVRGEQVSGEYRGLAPRLTGDGWFPTHDGGWLDSDGFLHVTGRIDDVIVKGGQNISPSEIEEVLVAREDVADAAAIGLPDRQWGERIVAAVVPAPGAAPTAEDLQDAVRSLLRSNRTPDHVEFVDALPYNDTGKLLRRVLRADLAHLGDGSTT